MNSGPSDTWLTHDAAAEELENICERCGGYLAVAVDPEGTTVYCTGCPPKHQTTYETRRQKTNLAADAASDGHAAHRPQFLRHPQSLQRLAREAGIPERNIQT
jgi:hypothetical protein